MCCSHCQKGGRAPDEVVRLVVVDGDLGRDADAGHDADRVGGVLAVGGLATEHNSRGAVPHGVGNVSNLGAGGVGIVDHRLHHLHTLQT